jgi:amino acid transporter
VILVNPGYNTTLSYAAGSFLVQAFPQTFPPFSYDPAMNLKLIGFAVLTLQTLACVPSNQLAGKFLTTVSVVSVLSLSLFCGCGVLSLFGVFAEQRAGSALSSSTNLWAGTSNSPGNWASAFLKVMWTFDGFSNLSSSLGELKNPERNIRRATYMGMGTISVLYLLANLTYFAMLPFDVLASSGVDLPIVWGERVFGPSGKIAVALVLFFVVSACNFTSLFSSSRIAQAIGESELIIGNSFFARLNGRFGTPVNALIFNYVMATVLLFAPQGGAYWFIMDLVSVPLWVFYFFTALGLLIVKRRTMGTIFGQDIRIKGVQVSPFNPMLVMMFAAFCVFFPIFDDNSRLPTLVGIGIILLGLVPYYFKRRSLSSVKLDTK